MKKMLFVGLAVTLMSQPLEARKIFPSDVLGRNLQYPNPIGWLGHVAIATRDMMNANGMSTYADQVIEILNEPPNYGKINTIDNFKSRSPYWGSKYGVIASPQSGYQVLVEANHQRWWVREYTFGTDYRIAQGNPRSGEFSVSGKWRCDTYVWWAFYSQGYNLMPGTIWLPSVLFNAVPYFNNEKLIPDSLNGLSTLSKSDKTLDDFTSEELNEMPFEEFQMIIDNPPAPPAQYVSAPMSSYMRFAFDNNLNDIERGMMLDKITSHVTDNDLVTKLLRLYDETNSEEVKDKVVSNLMFHATGYLKEHPNADDKELLRTFFYRLIDEKLNQQRADWAVMAFLSLYNADEITKNLDKIDIQLASMAHHASILNKYSLVFVSKELQTIYIKSILDELRSINNSEIDDYFFGPLSIGYTGSGKDLLLPENTQLIIDYLKEVHDKYTDKGIKEGIKTGIKSEQSRGMTSMDYNHLLKAMDIKL